MDVPKPSETFLVVEVNDYNVYSTGNLWNDTHLDWGSMTAAGFHNAPAANCTTSASKITTRHFTGANYLYADGHVKWHASGTVRAADYTLQDD
jgi:prepilin-type processing-associated H-X9-DG protein